MTAPAASPLTTIMWLALPAGVVAGATPATAAVSVFVSPRLTGPAGATLADFPPLARWADTVAGTAFELALPDGSPVAATRVSPPPDPQLWAQLFPPATPVIARGFDQSGVQGRTPSTYSQQAVHDYCQSGYVGMHTASPVSVPAHQQLQQLLPAFTAPAGPRPLLFPAAGSADELTALHQAAATVADDLVAHAAAGTMPEAVAHAQAIATRLAALSPPGTHVPLVAATDAPQSDVGGVLAFHYVPPQQAGVSPGPKTDPVAPDFHAILTSLLAYPALLRKLGLVIDLQVPLNALPSSALPGSAGSAPWTAYTRDGDQVFAAAPATPDSPEVLGGLVNLALPDQYALFQLDVDGAALKAHSAANAPVDPDQPSPLPSLRTTGLTLSRSGQSQQLGDRITANAANDSAVTANPAAAITLYAEDIMHGLRLDVYDETAGAWASLHRRVGTYTLAGQPVLAGAEDEGAAQPSASHLPDVGSPSPLRVAEALTRWEGWSLSVPRPGAAVTDAGPARVPSVPAAGGVPLTVSFTAAPGSLPRLRYGRSYQVRARAVDVSGYSLSLADADALLHSLAETGRPVPVLTSGGTGTGFQRFEPVTGPVLVARERYTEGESAERMVIRSDQGEDAAACGRRLSGLSGSTGLRYLAVSERHLVPPKITLTEAERSGKLDGLAPAAAYALAHRNGGQLTDTFVTDLASGAPVPLAAVPDTSPATGAPAVPRPAVELVSSGTSAYAVHHEALLTVPYLPDPMSAGVVLCGLPGQAPATQGTLDPSGALRFDPWSLDSGAQEQVGCTTSVGFSGTWPQPGPVRLSLTEGSAPPSWDAAGRVLTVALPQGRSATVRLSSFLPDDALEVLGIWSWVLADLASRNQPPPSNSDRELALRGLAWLLTPYREITLVHAVQRPLAAPALSGLTAARQPGDTGAALSASIAVDGPSTARVDLKASWNDLVDDLTSDGPVQVAGHAAVLSVTLPPADDIGQPAGPVLSVAGRHELGDTRYRQVTYTATAASAFREYFPDAVADDDTTVTGTPVTVTVPSSVRPPAPVLRAAVPVFSWQRPPGLAGVRVRTQVGIRLLLERPWMASGADEQLAVLLAPTGAYPPGDDLRPYVTFWGRDPIWGGPVTAAAPDAAAFGSAQPPLTLTLPEAGPVQVVPLPVSYDSAQGLWTCDVPVTVPADQYEPFVRLAVARYQPNSAGGAELSTVALAPPVQILPQRTVTVTAGSDPDTVQLRVDGTSYWSVNGVTAPQDPTAEDGHFLPLGIRFAPAPDLVEVSVQQRIPGTTDDAGWRPLVADQAAGALPSAVVSGLGTGTANTLLWQGTVVLPPGRSPGQFRILVGEYQLLPSDVVKTYSWEEPASDDGNGSGKFPTIAPPAANKTPNKNMIDHSSYYWPGSRRLVFAEAIPV